MIERTEFGARRLHCDCSKCKAACQCLPGNLIPSDLDRLIPPGADPFVWAHEHLQADESGALKVMTKPDGSCHWFHGGRCAVHEMSPFRCAFFGCPKVQTPEEAATVAQAGEEATLNALADPGSLYRRLWEYLWQVGRRRIAADKLAAKKRLGRLLRRM
jgi:hypothetical protein